LPTRNYLLRDGVEKTNQWDSVESIPFYAFEPKRAYEGLVPIYAQKEQEIRLILECPNNSAEPLFYALPSGGSQSENSCIVPLYEYYHDKTKRRIYSTKSSLQEQGWNRMEKPLCRVFKSPSTPPLLDSKAKPATRR